MESANWGWVTHRAIALKRLHSSRGHLLTSKLLKIGLDTNILLRVSNRGDGQHQKVVDQLESFHVGGDELVICDQVLTELWVVATRPISANGLGATAQAVSDEIARLQSIFTVVPNSSDTFKVWLETVQQVQAVGARAHDVKLEVTYTLAGCQALYTLNQSDFQGIQSSLGLIVL